MTIENELAKLPQGAGFTEAIVTRPEFKMGKSRVRAFADFAFNEGARGLEELYYRVTTYAGAPIPDPHSPLMPEEFRAPIARNGGAVLWGTLFATFEELMRSGTYTPDNFRKLLTHGFFKTGWGNAFRPKEDQEVITYTSDQLALLAEKATEDKALSFLFKVEGLKVLPEQIADDLVNTRFYADMRDNFGPYYLPRARLLVTSPLTPQEIRLRGRSPNNISDR